tara:strand:+ start:367 stop:498 length:132 start_codon:yes stop_codon:yes gene_type:complete
MLIAMILINHGLNEKRMNSIGDLTLGNSKRANAQLAWKNIDCG